MNAQHFILEMIKHFNCRNPNIFMCQTTFIESEVDLDLFEFDQWLHEVHGNYEDCGMSMSDIILKHYGKKAHTFIKSLMVE